MTKLILLNDDELSEFDGGGVASMAAGAIAGAMIGTIISLPAAAVTGDTSLVGKAAIAGGSIGAYVGAGCPLP